MTERINTFNGTVSGLAHGAGNPDVRFFNGYAVVRRVAAAIRTLVCRVAALLATQSLVTVVAAALWTFMSFGLGAYRSGVVSSVVFFIALRPFVSRSVEGTPPSDYCWDRPGASSGIE